MLKNISHYGIATIITNIIAIVSLPFFTRYLTPADFGILAIYAIFGSITSNFLSVGLMVATERFYYKEKNNTDYFSALNFTNLIFILLNMILLTMD